MIVYFSSFGGDACDGYVRGRCVVGYCGPGRDRGRGRRGEGVGEVAGSSTA